MWAVSDIVSVAIIGAGASITTAVLSRGRKTQTRIADQLQPSNGSTLAQTVESIERTGEITQGRVHDISKRVDAQGREVAEIRHHQKGIEANLIGIGDKLEEHMEERTTFEPLIGWVRKRMEEEA